MPVPIGDRWVVLITHWDFAGVVGWMIQPMHTGDVARCGNWAGRGRYHRRAIGGIRRPGPIASPERPPVSNQQLDEVPRGPRRPTSDLPSMVLQPSRHAATELESLGGLGALAARIYLLIAPSIMLGAFLGNDLPATLVFVLPAFGVLLIAPRRLLLRMPISPALALLLCWIILSYAWSVSRPTTLFNLREDLAPVFGLIIVVGLVPIEETVKWLVRGFKLMVLASLLVVLFFPETRVSVFEGEETQAWEAWFVSKNQLGRSALVAYLFFLIVDRSGFTRYLALAASLVLVVGSSSATGVAGVIVGTAVWLWAWQFRRVGEQWSATYVIASVTGGVVAITAAYASAAYLVGLLGRDLTFSGRSELWQPSLDAIADKPWVGYGYRALFTPETQETLDLWREIGFRASHSHNGPLEVTLGIGAIGLFLFFIFYLSTFTAALRYLKRSDIAVFTFTFCLLQLIVAFVEPVFLRDWLNVLVISRVLLMRMQIEDRADHRALMTRTRGRFAMTLGDYSALESTQRPRGRRTI